MRSHGVSRAIVSAIVVLAALLTACSSKPSPYGSSPTPGSPAPRLLAGTPMTACTVAGEVPVKAAVAGVCGTLVVPEDRANPAGRNIGLRVAVVPALAAAPASDPLFAIAGGPGDASTSFFAWLPGLYTGVHATRDIVLVDQRGTGGSNALRLPPLPDTAGLPASDASARLAAWAHAGLAVLDADPRFYTSTVAADDLDAVRAALGYDRIDLYGTSYGGTLAQYYLRQHGEHVRVAVLDGATPLDVPIRERIAANSQHALDLLLSRCSADAACHAAFPDLAGEWATLAGLRPGRQRREPRESRGAGGAESRWGRAVDPPGAAHRGDGGADSARHSPRGHRSVAAREPDHPRPTDRRCPTADGLGDFLFGGLGAVRPGRAGPCRRRQLPA